MSSHLQHYKNKTVVVTGASGYIASALLDKLQETGARIIRVSRKNIPRVSWADTLKADLQSIYSWEEIIQKADIIFHLAGNTSVYDAQMYPADSLNSTVLPLIYLVAAAQESGRKPRVVFASTATVYGLTQNLPVSEATIPKPVTNYDLHKLFAEKQLELATERKILEGISLRISNVYGPGAGEVSAEDRGILNKITRQALNGGSLQLYGGGEYIRDYIFIDDVARAFIVAGIENTLVGQPLNVGSGRGISVRDAFTLVAKRAESVTGKSVLISDIPWPEDADPIEFRNYFSDVSRFVSNSGWESKISFEYGIDLMIDNFRNKYIHGKN